MATPSKKAEQPPASPEVSGIFESLPLGVLVFDGHLRVVFQNAAARCVFSDVRELAKALDALTIESRYQDWDQILHDVFSSRQSQRFDGLAVRHEGKPDRYLNLYFSAIESAETSPSQWGLLIVEDVSSRISMEQRLAVSERLAAVGKLCASVAHDLNNPLDGILRYVNLALRKAEAQTDERMIEYLRYVRDGTMRMVQVVRALLDFSRSTPPALADQNINKLVEEALRTMELRAAESQIAIITHFHQSDVPTIPGGNLFQVFCNLIKNAIDAMPTGGTLSIVTRIEGSDAIIAFADTGSGLPGDPERLFEPFFTTKPPGQGTGLGLAVSREIVQKYGGRITAVNRPDGPGSVFTVQIPTHGATSPFSAIGVDRLKRLSSGSMSQDS